jgi:hypothetical protein
VAVVVSKHFDEQVRSYLPAEAAEAALHVVSIRFSK